MGKKFTTPHGYMYMVKQRVSTKAKLVLLMNLLKCTREAVCLGM